MYSNPTPNFLCLTSIECCNARIFICSLHKMILPSPKNSVTRTNSFPNPSNLKYAIRSAPICLIFLILIEGYHFSNVFVTCLVQFDHLYRC